MLISVSMLMSMFVSTVAFADDRIYADPEMVTYMPATGSNVGDTKIYMQDNYANAGYHIKHFLRDGERMYTLAAMAWPPALRTNRSGDYPEQKATINNTDNTITSTASGITYKLPDLNAPTAAEIAGAQASTPTQFHKKEAMILDAFGTRNYAYGSKTSANLELNDNYDKISFLIGVADTAADMVSEIAAFVTYSDGTNTLPDGASERGSSAKYWTFPAGTADSEAADGRNGYLVIGSPKATAAGQSAADNFVADFESYIYKPNKTAGSTSDITARFTKSTGANGTIAAYEYTLDVDENKKITSITFNHNNKANAAGNSVSSGYAVLGLVGQKKAEDWTDKIVEINADIDELTAEGAQITSNKILSTLTAINEAKNKGVGEHIKIDDFNALFTDDLVNDLFEGTNLNQMSWEDEGDFFQILDSIYYAVENTENNVSVVTKEWMTDAYSELIDSLIEEDEKNEEELKARFDLLKSATVLDFQNIFEQKIIYEAGNLAISSGHEEITLEIDFSQPIRSSQLTKDNFIVKRDNEVVNPKWITFEPKRTGEDITGVKVKVLNTQEYVKPYTLHISREMTGANGGRWAYQFEEKLNANAPITAKTDAVVISDANVISGNVSLESSMSESQSYVVLISSYDEKGMYLGTISATGTVSSGASADISINEQALPEGTSKVICYVVDSLSNMTLLTPPVTLK